jgi:hypothetical protein
MDGAGERSIRERTARCRALDDAVQRRDSRAADGGRMKRFSCSSFLLAFFLAGSSYAHFTGAGHIHTVSENKQAFVNRDCRSTDSCDLKRFTLTTSVYEAWFSDDPEYPTYGNGVIMEYETDSLAALEKYAIVQFKKGCVFYTSRTAEGRILRNIGDTVPSFGENIPYCFPHWVIDSQDTDPAYNSDPEHGRFHLLRWNKPGSHDERSQKYYGAERPTVPVVYMADYPAGAFVTTMGVKNVALEFNTCIYKASDVPAHTRRDDIEFARPITCLEWQNVYVYDFAAGRFRTDLANLPKWEEPSTVLNLYSVVVFITLFVAINLIAFAQLGRLVMGTVKCTKAG